MARMDRDRDRDRDRNNETPEFEEKVVYINASCPMLAIGDNNKIKEMISRPPVCTHSKEL